MLLRKLQPKPSKLQTKKRCGCWKRPNLEMRRSRVCGKNWPTLRMAKRKPRMGEKEVEARLASAEADFVENFHNIEAYTNFADYFARVGQQEVLTVLRNNHPDFDVKNLEARFPLPDAGSKDDS
ncbi:hypothetical protein Adt_28339 [Abeliophyllum distichum]|uniref:Uncharacterized protein n=1 Tax=Abeliophyllum distichum TaxID=126358 RepID=A0ABD1RWB8_9LAMI